MRALITSFIRRKAQRGRSSSGLRLPPSTMAGCMTKTAARRTAVIKVRLSPAEALEIQRRAAAARLAAAPYLRILGLGWTPKSTLDHQAMLELSKVNADLGRLSGLLKLWLTSQPGQGVPATDVRRVLHGIEESQARLRQIIGKL